MQGTLLTRSTREGWPSDQPQTTLSVASWLAANIAKKRQLCIQDVGVLFDSGGEPHNATVNYVYCAWLIKWAANYPVGSTVGYMMMICIKWKQLVLDGTGSAYGLAILAGTWGEWVIISWYCLVLWCTESVQYSFYVSIYWTKWRFGWVLPVPNRLADWLTTKYRATLSWQLDWSLKFKLGHAIGTSS